MLSRLAGWTMLLPPRQLLAADDAPIFPIGQSGVLGWVDVPMVIYIVLVAPRQRLDIFTDEKARKAGASSLHTAISNTTTEPIDSRESIDYEGTFHAIDVCFGTFNRGDGIDLLLD